MSRPPGIRGHRGSPSPRPRRPPRIPRAEGAHTAPAPPGSLHRRAVPVSGIPAQCRRSQPRGSHAPAAGPPGVPVPAGAAGPMPAALGRAAAPLLGGASSPSRPVPGARRRVRRRRARGSAGRGGARSPVPGRSRRGGAGRGAEPRDGERAREPSPGALGEPRSRYRERCGGCAPRCRGPPVCRCCCAGQRSAGWPRGCGSAWIPEGESVGVWSICFAPENSLQSSRSPGLAVGARCFPAATFGGLCPIPRSSRGEAGALGHQQQSHLSLNSPLWSAWSWQGLAWGCNGAPSPPEPRRKLRQGWKEPAAPGMGGGAQCPVLPSQGSRHGQSLG